MPGIVYSSHRKPAPFPKMSDEAVQMTILGGIIALVLVAAFVAAALISRGIIPMPGP